VRDPASYERVRRIAPDVHVELTFDLSVLLPLVTKSDTEGISRLDRSLGIAMCNYRRISGVDDELHRIRAVAEAVRKTATAGRIDEVVLFDFNGQARCGDAEVSNALAVLLRGTVPVRRVMYTPDPASALRAMARLKGVLAMRMHSAIFAFCTATPFVMLAYHEKCHELADLIGLPAELRHDSWNLQVDALSRSIELILNDEAPTPSLPVEKAVDMALRNWTWLNRP
jgi:polysaccharide pyruvyl transferase WcaK-like protein